MDYKLIILAILILGLIYLYNLNTPRELILALNVLIILLLNDILRKSEHFENKMIDKDLLDGIKKMINEVNNVLEK